MVRFPTSSLIRSGCPFAIALVAAGVIMIGCGGRGNDADRRRPDGSSDRRSMAAPAFDAPADAVGAFINGDWRIVLLPEAGEVEVNAPMLDGTFDVGDFYDDEAMMRVSDLTGAVGGTGMTGGRLTVSNDGSALPMLEFTTPNLTLDSLTGETITVEGPIGWTAQLSDGMLIGTATGPDGRVSAWEGSRNEGSRN